MEDKYYTPEIEEFHVGFECELLHSTNGWVKYTNPPKNPMNINSIKEGVRVKYLNKEGIESLGFKQLDKINSSRFIKGNISIWLGDMNKGMLTKIEISENVTRGITSFLGNIKNKSELKKLIKQLNIE